MKTLEEKIKESEEKLQQMKLKKAQIERAAKLKETKKQRAEDTRKKILIGSYFLSKMKEDQSMKEKIESAMDKYLERSDDRKLFSLQPR